MYAFPAQVRKAPPPDLDRSVSNLGDDSALMNVLKQADEPSLDAVHIDLPTPVHRDSKTASTPKGISYLTLQQQQSDKRPSSRVSPVPPLNLSGVGAPSSRASLRKYGSLVLSRNNLSEHDRQMSIIYKQSYIKDMMQEPRECSPRQPPPLQIVSSSRAASQHIEQLEEYRDTSRISRPESSPVKAHPDDTTSQKKVTQSSSQISRVEDLPLPSAKPSLLAEKPPELLESILYLKKPAIQEDEKAEQGRHGAEKQEDEKMASGNKAEDLQGVVSALSNKIGMENKDPSSFAVLMKILDQNIEYSAVEQLLLLLDEQVGVKKTYLETARMVQDAWSLVLGEQTQAVHYWLMDIRQEEFLVELGKAYAVFDPNHRGAMTKENLEAWLKIFINQTSPKAVATAFGLWKDDPKKKKKYLKGGGIRKDQVLATIVQELLGKVNQSSTVVKLPRISGQFMLYFLSRIGLKIERRRALYQAVRQGEGQTKGLHQLFVEATKGAKFIDVRVLEGLVMEYFKMRVELTSSNLYALLSTFKKYLRGNQFETNNRYELCYGDIEKPNFRHLSTWLPYNISLQLIASELDECADESTFFSSYSMIQEQRFMEAAVFSKLIDPEHLRPTLSRMLKRRLNTEPEKPPVFKQSNSSVDSGFRGMSSNNQKFRSKGAGNQSSFNNYSSKGFSKQSSSSQMFKFMRSKTRLSQKKVTFDQSVEIIAACFPPELQYLTNQECERMIFSMLYCMARARMPTPPPPQAPPQLSPEAVTQKLFTMQELITVVKQMPHFVPLVYCLQMLLKLSLGKEFSHAFVPYDFFFEQEDLTSVPAGGVSPTANKPSRIESNVLSENLVAPFESKGPEAANQEVGSAAIERRSSLAGIGEQSEVKTVVTKSRRQGVFGSRPKKAKNFIKCYIYLDKYFTEFQKKLEREHVQQQKEKKELEAVQKKINNETPDPSQMPEFQMAGNEILLRPEKFLHEKVGNLQDAMVKAWDEERRKDQTKIKKLEQASKQLVFKWTRKGERNLGKHFSQPDQTMSTSVTFGPKKTQQQKPQRVDCSCAIF